MTSALDRLDAQSRPWDDQLELLRRDVELESLVLTRSGYPRLDIADSIVSGDVERTMDGASTLTVTVQDSSRRLIESGRLETDKDRLATVRTHVDGLGWELEKVTKQGDQLTLTFEDLEVSLLRRHRKFRKAARSKVTRAQFVLSLVREVKFKRIKFHCPELNKVQPIASTKSSKDSERKGGFADNYRVKVKGATGSKAQTRIAERVLDTCAKVGAGPRATLAALAAVTVECEFKNEQGKGRDAVSYGVIQAIPGTSGRMGGGSFTKEQALDVEFSIESALKYSCTGFENHLSGGGGLIGVARRHPDWTVGRIAAVVINGAVNNGQGAPGYVKEVNKWADEARKTIDDYGGASSGGGTKFKRYEFKRNKGESSWDCIQRLAQEVGWRAFMVSGTLYFMSEDDLLKSRPRMQISEDSDGVDSIDFDWDQGKRVATATVQCRMDRWDAPPGSVVIIEKSGPANGRWLVASVRRGLFSADGEITLKKAVKPKPEPAAEQASSGGAGGTGDSSGDDSGKLPNTYPGSPIPGQRPHSATHQTAGLPGYPAFDYMASAGTSVVAPEDGKVFKLSGKDPSLGGPPGGALGYSIYIQGKSGKKYFLTHLDKVAVKVGDNVEQGHKIAVVADGPASWSSPHCHMGVNG